MASKKSAVVIDNGASMVKAGFGGDDAPRACFPPIVGSPRPQSATVVGADQKDTYVGDEAYVKRDVLYPKSPVPIERGIITDWDGMEKVWHHTFYNELRVAPEEHSVLVTESPTNPRPNRERMVQILFEKFNPPAVFLANQAVLALFASGQLSGMVLDCGEGVSHAVPVHNGYAVREGITQLKLGGRDLTHYMMKLLNERGYHFTRKDQEAAQEVKENLGCVAPDPLSQGAPAPPSSLGAKKSYDLPDGRTVTLNDTERFRCPEALFQPAVLGLDSADGVHKMIHQSILKCDAGTHDGLFRRIVLAGGSTLFPGMAERVRREMVALAPGAADRVTIVDPPSRLYSAWIGGSLLATVDSFQDKWVTREQYEESGAAIVHEKPY